MNANSVQHSTEHATRLIKERVLIFQEASCAYVIILMAVYWCTEALPLAVTALLPAVLFPMFGIMQSKVVRRSLCFR